MTRFSLLLLAAVVAAQDPGKGGGDKPAVDVGKVLRESKEFAQKCKEFGIAWEPGVVRAQGEVHYRGGGPCEYLVGVFPAKAHETIVLLDKGPWKGEGRRPREAIQDMATILNNAFLAAGYERGKAFDWDRKTGDVFPPKGPTVHIYAEWKDGDKQKRARMSDWLWNFRRIEVMDPGKFVYTGSVMLEEPIEDGKTKLWLGAEVDGLVVAVLNTSSALLDNTEEGSLDNGAYEAIPIRIPESGTRVTVAFSKKELELTENYPPLKLPKELIEEKTRRAEAEARKKLDEPEKDSGEEK